MGKSEVVFYCLHLNLSLQIIILFNIAAVSVCISSNLILESLNVWLTFQYFIMCTQPGAWLCPSHLIERFLFVFYSLYYIPLLKSMGEMKLVDYIPVFAGYSFSIMK